MNFRRAEFERIPCEEMADIVKSAEVALGGVMRGTGHVDGQVELSVEDARAANVIVVLVRYDQGVDIVR